MGLLRWVELFFSLIVSCVSWWVADGNREALVGIREQVVVILSLLASQERQKEVACET